MFRDLPETVVQKMCKDSKWELCRFEYFQPQKDGKDEID